jgi:hypothetical protein
MVEPKLHGRLTKPHVYYAGAHTGCSCGFFYDLRWEPAWEYEEDDQLRSLESAEALVSFLRVQLQTCNELEIYVRWEGDQDCSKKRLQRLRATPSDFLSDRFTPEEEELYIVTSD